MQISSLAVSKYLEHYAEKEIHQTPAIHFTYDQVLVIPAFDEKLSFWQSLKSSKPLNRSKFTLTILVVNSPVSSSVCYNNHELVKTIKDETDCLEKTEHQLLLELTENQHILLIDRYSANLRIPDSQGVGLARKIGSDIALDLINKEKIISPWIHTTDADTELPENYFDACEQETPEGALLYPFAHTHENEYSRFYDFSLYYYVAGLKLAGSPYAFHTLGSIIACHYQSYAEVRGYPKKSAGEDFYFLNKVAKVGMVKTLETSPLIIQARPSIRVPFGTGPAIIKIANLDKPMIQYLYYHPQVFNYLKVWLNVIKDLWLFNNDSANKAIEQALSQNLLTYESYKTFGNEELDGDFLKACLQALNVEIWIKHGFDQCKSEMHFLQHMNHAFDAFRTLKFIHYVRDNKYKSISLNNLIDQQALDVLGLTNEYSSSFNSKKLEK